MLKLLYVKKSFVDDLYTYLDRDEIMTAFGIENEIDCFNKIMRLHLSENNVINNYIPLNQIDH